MYSRFITMALHDLGHIGFEEPFPRFRAHGMIVKDGEGATHLIEVRVKNARKIGDARRAARAVAGSNLVKTAIFGRDPNWGRIAAALGYSGVSFKPSK
jgi:glutamate N-acetyltransferase/amino-acid N-acetyltransferase